MSASYTHQCTFCSSIPVLATLSHSASINRQICFDELVAEVHGCSTCPRMAGRTRVFSAANGPLTPTVLFIAEAPGRLGADQTAIPLSGDSSGRNFDLLLAESGLSRDSVFVTNAVLCNPRDELGRNAAPSTSEIWNCSEHLKATIRLLSPPVVVTLGATALRALSIIERHGLELAQDVGGRVRWNGRWLAPLYHPGARAQIRRSLGQQQEDFRQLGEFVRSSHGI